jgi:hypothetical protein
VKKQRARKYEREKLGSWERESAKTKAQNLRPKKERKSEDQKKARAYVFYFVPQESCTRGGCATTVSLELERRAIWMFPLA